MKVFEGIPASPGIATGEAFPVVRKDLRIERREIDAADVAAEEARLEKAVALTRDEFAALRDEVSRNDAAIKAEILDAYTLILDDEMLLQNARAMVAAELVSAEFAFKTTLDGMLEVFERMEDPYFRERAVDLRDVGNRVVMNLLGVAHRFFDELNAGSVVIAHDLSPSETAGMPRGKVAALVTEVGSLTSHTAIMAQAMEVPAVLGASGVVGYVRAGDRIIVDGRNGRVYVNPDAETQEGLARAARSWEDQRRQQERLAALPAITRDGYRIELSANIEVLEELDAVKRHGCDGVGLYRTEFLYLHRTDLPAEEEQLDVYRRVAETCQPHSAIIRTIDIGGDKFLSFPEVARELNPFLGLRAIRFCLARQDLFRVQLRAILRASVYGKLKIMFPMVSDVEELRAANRILAEVRKELEAEKTPFDADLEVGIMVEVPSAALSADTLARECDFFSLGTNDLIQYTLAADRGNEKIAYLYEPFHPAVLRLIKSTVDAARANGIWVGVCGQMVTDPKAAVLLLGLSCDEFSASPASVPTIKTTLRSVRHADARRVAENALRLDRAAAVRAYLEGALVELGVPTAKELL